VILSSMVMSTHGFRCPCIADKRQADPIIHSLMKSCSKSSSISPTSPNAEFLPSTSSNIKEMVRESGNTLMLMRHRPQARAGLSFIVKDGLSGRGSITGWLP
jgi:hypothetical protein